MKVGLIGVPTNHGCDKDGVQYGPHKLRSSLENTFKNENIEVEYIKDIDVEIIHKDDKFKDDQNIKYYKSIHNTNEKLANTIYEALDEGYFPIILGGDHSLGLGSISGASKYFNNLGVA